jgi:acetyl-CoA carboxylase biotin carboxyl carrier protein
MEFKEIQELIRMISKSNLAEVRIEKDSFKITIRTQNYYSASTRSESPIYIQAPQSGIQAQVPTYSAPTAISSSSETQQAASAQSVTPAKESASSDSTSNFITIKAPMVGTFYRSAGPDKEPFVKVGDEIKTGTVICVIEAMKLFNEIESEVSGRVVKILVENSKPIEYDQPLFLIEPI